MPLAEALFRSRQLLSSEIQDASSGVMHKRNEYKAEASLSLYKHRQDSQKSNTL